MTIRYAIKYHTINAIPAKREEANTMPSIKCKDIGMKCGFEVKDDSRDELMQILALHAEKTHNMKTIPPEVMEKVQKAIKK
jgi:predicted small metal-binding protein